MCTYEKYRGDRGDINTICMEENCLKIKQEMRPSLTEKVVSPIRVYNDRSFPRLVPFIGGEMFAMEFESSTPSRASVLPKLSSTSPFAVMCRFTSTRPSGPLYPVAGFKGTLEKKSARPPTVIHSLPFDFPCFHVKIRYVVDDCIASPIFCFR